MTHPYPGQPHLPHGQPPWQPPVPQQAQVGSGMALAARLLALACVAATLVVLLAFWFVLGGSDPYADRNPLGPLWPVLTGALWLAVIALVGYRAAPLPAGSTAYENASTVRTRWITALTVRLTMCGIFALGVLAYGFVSTGDNFLHVAVGLGVTVVLVAAHVWPWRRGVERFTRALEAAGGHSGLREGFGPRPAR